MKLKRLIAETRYRRKPRRGSPRPRRRTCKRGTAARSRARLGAAGATRPSSRGSRRIWPSGARSPAVSVRRPMGEPGVRPGSPRLGLLARAHLDPVALRRPRSGGRPASPRAGRPSSSFRGDFHPRQSPSWLLRDIAASSSPTSSTPRRRASAAWCRTRNGHPWRRWDGAQPTAADCARQPRHRDEL